MTKTTVDGAIDWAAVMETAQALSEASPEAQAFGLAQLEKENDAAFIKAVKQMLDNMPKAKPSAAPNKAMPPAPLPLSGRAGAPLPSPQPSSTPPAEVEPLTDPVVIPSPGPSDVAPVVKPRSPNELALDRKKAEAEVAASGKAAIAEEPLAAPKLSLLERDLLARKKPEAVMEPAPSDESSVVVAAPDKADADKIIKSIKFVPKPSATVAPMGPVGASILSKRMPGLSPEAKAAVLRVIPPSASVTGGVVNEIADFFLSSAMYPSEKFAKATALGLVGTLISRRIAGPSGPRGVGTHHYQALIATTANGKEHARATGKLLLAATGASGLIAARFKSGAGIVKHLISHPVSLNFMDELGAVFAMLADPRTAGYVRDVNEVLRELWGLSWGRYDSPVGALDKMETVIAPALSIIGLTTPQELYRACRSRDVANGFLNRFLFVEEKALLPYQEVPEDAMDPSVRLVERLCKLYQPNVQIDPTGKPPIRLGWGPGAKEIFDEVREACRDEKDERRRDLLGRTAEKTVRVATTIAAGDFSDIVTRQHMTLALDWVRASDATLWDGVTEYMEEEKLEFDELCREIIRRIRRSGGTMKERDIKRSFQGNVRLRRDLDNALHHLTDSEQLIFAKEQTGGRPSYIYSLPKEGNT